MGQQTYGAYEKLLERALEHDATVIMTGTLENAQTWYADLWEKWQGHNPEGGKSFSLPTWSNSKVFPGGRTDPKIKNLENGIPPELFLERVAAVPYKPSGLVFKLFDRKRHVGDYSFNEKLPIELAIDPAQHTYAIEAMQWETRKVKDWFEHLELAGAGKRTKEELAKELTMVYVVDEIYEHDMIAQDIISVVKERPWYPFVKTGVIDIAGTYKTATKSQQQVWAEETGIRLRGKLISIPEGIDVVKLRLRNDPILGVPLLYFDYRLRADKDYAGRANGIVAEAGLYRWPDWKAGMSSAARPVDANNDGWKAVGYWCYDRFGPVVERKKMRRGVVRDYF